MRVGVSYVGVTAIRLIIVRVVVWLRNSAVGQVLHADSQETLISRKRSRNYGRVALAHTVQRARPAGFRHQLRQRREKRSRTCRAHSWGTLQRCQCSGIGSAIGTAKAVPHVRLILAAQPECRALCAQHRVTGCVRIPGTLVLLVSLNRPVMCLNRPQALLLQTRASRSAFAQ